MRVVFFCRNHYCLIVVVIVIITFITSIFVTSNIIIMGIFIDLLSTSVSFRQYSVDFF